MGAKITLRKECIMREALVSTPSMFAAMLASALTAWPSLSEGTQPGGKLIFEYAVKTISARQYSEILSRACRNGWRYPRSQIESGFRRHFEELKVQLVARGYTIMAGPPEAPIGTKRGLPAARHLGCSGAYWLKD